MRHLRRLGNQIKVFLPVDESGYVGRECPNSNCRGYFKIVPGTGLNDVTVCHCPYCGHTADQSEFDTPDQIEYAKSVEIREITAALDKDLKSLEFESKPKGPFGIGISMKVQPGPRYPIHRYREKALETHVKCSSCTLSYAIFGVFAFCPGCRQHNSLQILAKNFELVLKMLDMTATVEPEIAERLAENALEDCISAFDGYGREICRIHSNRAAHSAKVEKLSFQNLDRASQSITDLFGIDLAGGVTDDEWKIAVQGFQKRHLLAHKMGVIDDEYVRKSGDSGAVAGRKVRIEANEVRELVLIVDKLARHLSASLDKLEKNP